MTLDQAEDARAIDYAMAEVPESSAGCWSITKYGDVLKDPEVRHALWFVAVFTWLSIQHDSNGFQYDVRRDSAIWYLRSDGFYSKFGSPYQMAAVMVLLAAGREVPAWLAT